MYKKRSLSLILFGIILLNLGLVLAVSGVDIKITGVIGDYSSDVYLKTISGATTGYDAYDMPKPISPPSGSYSEFYSSITGQSLAIDTWNEVARSDIDLTYDVPSGESGTVSFTWEDISSGADYTVSMTISGNVVNMVSDSDNTYTYTATDGESIYITVNVGNVIVDDDDDQGEDAGGGGGGGAAPSTIPVLGDDIFIGNLYIDTFIGINVLDGIGYVKTEKINLFNQASEPIDVNLVIPEELKDILQIKDKDLSFTMKGRERKIIDIRIIAPSLKGKYKGILYVDGKSRQKIYITVTATDKELWFDAELEIPWRYNIIEKGTRLLAKLKLRPQGLEVGFDVSTTYIIREFVDGNEIPTGITKTKKFFVDGDYDENLEFLTEGLDVGKYVLELELDYPNEVAISRASFEVREDVDRGGLQAILDYRFILLIFSVGILILLAFIMFVLLKHKKVKRKISRG